MTTVIEKALPQTKYLWFLTLSFAMVVSISNWYDARLVSLFGFAVAPGTLSYPLSFLIADSITEVYGYKKARLAIWAALFFNVMFLLFGQLVIHLPSPSFASENTSFDKLLTMNFWIVCASFISFLIVEPFSSYLVAKLKILMRGNYMGIRFIFTTILAAFLDSVLFILIAFYHAFDINNLWTMIINIWLIKTFIEIIFLPFSIRITKWLKRTEQMDIYDYHTNFNIFSLDGIYPSKNNYYLSGANK